MCAVSCPLNDDPVEIRILYIWVQQGLRANMLTVLYCTASTCFGVPAYQYNQNGSWFTTSQTFKPLLSSGVLYMYRRYFPKLKPEWGDIRQTGFNHFCFVICRFTLTYLPKSLTIIGWTVPLWVKMSQAWRQATRMIPMHLLYQLNDTWKKNIHRWHVHGEQICYDRKQVFLVIL